MKEYGVLRCPRSQRGSEAPREESFPFAVEAIEGHFKHAERVERPSRLQFLARSYTGSDHKPTRSFQPIVALRSVFRLLFPPDSLVCLARRKASSHLIIAFDVDIGQKESVAGSVHW